MLLGDLLFAVRADAPAGFDRPVTVGTHLAQAPHAVRAHEVVVFDRRLAERTAQVAVEPLLEHAQLELAFAGVFEVLGGAQDGVDEEPERPEHKPGQHGHDDHHAIVDAPPGVFVDPVGARQPDDDEEWELIVLRPDFEDDSEDIDLEGWRS